MSQPDTQTQPPVFAWRGRDAQGRPALDAQTLSDPRWQRPYSGLYWQLDDVTPATARPGVLRGRLVNSQKGIAERHDASDFDALPPEKLQGIVQGF